MAQHKSISTLICIFFACSFLACSVSQTTSQSESKEEVNINKQNLDLTQLLQKEPGVYVRGTGYKAMITIRGANSLTLSNEPLFILNGQYIHNYPSLYDMVDRNSITSIRVLKNGGDTSFYGVRGSNGVIIIKTK